MSPLDNVRLPRPLTGLRVLDLSRVFAGPVAGRALSDLGADVVKVEPPDGDVTRLWGRSTAGLTTYFIQQNAGKRNVCVDLHHPDGPEIVARLAEVSDVFIENYRPGVLTRFGLDWAALSARNPRLVMLSISGFGQDGPESQRPAYASVIHAESGVIAQFAELEQSAPADCAFSAADVVSGLHGVIGVLAVLRQRDATGIGQHVDMAMLDAMAFSNDAIAYALDGDAPDRLNGEVWATVAGPICLAGGPRWVWQRMVVAHGLTDPTAPGADIPTKADNRRRAVEQYLCGLADRAAVIDALDAANLAWGEVRARRDVFDSPTMRARNTVVRVDNRAGGTCEIVQSPYRLSAAESGATGSAAHRGEHNGAVLADWLGLDAAQAAAIEASGAMPADSRFLDVQRIGHVSQR